MLLVCSVTLVIERNVAVSFTMWPALADFGSLFAKLSSCLVTSSHETVVVGTEPLFKLPLADDACEQCCSMSAEEIGIKTNSRTPSCQSDQRPFALFSCCTWRKHTTDSKLQDNIRDQPNSREEMHDFTAEFLKCVKFHGKFTERVSEIHGPHRRYFEVLR